jgi:hypothetical protein
MDSLIAAGGHLDCVQLSQLQPFTTLLVWTRNSMYRFVVVDHSNVWVQGGAHFGDATLAELAGASMGHGFVIHGCICIGLKIELHTRGTRLLTSPVVALTTESIHESVAH